MRSRGTHCKFCIARRLASRFEQLQLRGRRFALFLPAQVSFGMAMTTAKGATTAKGSKGRAVEVAKLLGLEYPDAECALKFSNPLQLLIATILSAQCTDVRVNM